MNIKNSVSAENSVIDNDSLQKSQITLLKDNSEYGSIRCVFCFAFPLKPVSLHCLTIISFDKRCRKIVITGFALTKTKVNNPWAI